MGAVVARETVSPAPRLEHGERARVVHVLRPGVDDPEMEPVGEAALQRRLQAVIAGVGVEARPVAEFGIEDALHAPSFWSFVSTAQFPT